MDINLIEDIKNIFSGDPLSRMSEIAAVVSIFIYPILRKLFSGFKFSNKFSKRKGEYEQAKELIHLIEEAKNSNKKPHPFLIEKGYALISGERRFNSDEITYCLSMNNPSQTLKYFSSGFYYLKYSKESKRFDYRKSADSSIKRKFQLTLWLLIYAFFGTVAFYVMLNAIEYYARSKFGVAIFLTIASVIFAINAIIFMSFGMNVRMAEKFMKLQDEMLKESDSLSTITNKSETKVSEVEEAEAANQEF